MDNSVLEYKENSGGVISYPLANNSRRNFTREQFKAFITRPAFMARNTKGEYSFKLSAHFKSESIKTYVKDIDDSFFISKEETQETNEDPGAEFRAAAAEQVKAAKPKPKTKAEKNTKEATETVEKSAKEATEKENQ